MYNVLQATDSDELNLIIVLVEKQVFYTYTEGECNNSLTTSCTVHSPTK